MLQGLFSIWVLAVVITLLIKQASITVWTISYAIIALLVAKYSGWGMWQQIALCFGFILLLLASIKPVRRILLTAAIIGKVRKAMPTMSATEREALEAGTISFEGQLFSGSPDFFSLLDTPKVVLTREEQAFLDGPTQTLCRQIDEWNITHNLTDMPADMWAFIKAQRFFGIIIPKEYGGLGFGATALMSIIVTLYSRSISVASTVSVPNSLGPAELLLKYGTDAQKNYYLPRLANGTEIPCFALTGPNAGSDAASIPDYGLVCKQLVDGKEVLGIKLTWNKRYITLCPVATLIGLAVKLFDPDNLLGKGNDIGITCVLVPADTPGVIKGRRHFPLNIAFLNGPTQGNEVFVGMDCVIGGVEQVGHGWRMLMECLSAGRAISLPSSALGGAQAAALASGAYARVRKQFNQPIGNFEGIEEPLTRIAASTYIIDAALTMTAAAIDKGAKPAVAGAILKYHATERARQIALDAMDIHGGKGICLGPNNYLGRWYQGTPISITVEGANILSRSLIIFGQGAIRCHPYVFQEMESIKNNDLVAFDKAIWGHIGFTLANLTKSLLFGMTGGRLLKTPGEKRTQRYYQTIYRYSSNLAFLADFSMITLGGELKRREKLSARMGDVLSNLYLASAVLKRFHDDGNPPEDLPLVDWSCQHLLQACSIAIQGVIANFPNRLMRGVLKMVLSPWGAHQQAPSDQLGHQVARLLVRPSVTRERLTRFVFTEPLENCPIGRLEAALTIICAVEALEKKVATAVKDKKLHGLTLLEQIDEAISQGILNKEEAYQLQQAELARQQVIAVDDFSHEELSRPMDAAATKKKGKPSTHKTASFDDVS